MSEGQVELPAADAADEPPAGPRRRRRWPWVLGAVGLVLLIALAIGWSMRKQIADDVIAGQLKQMDLPATYKVAKVGPGQQVLRNLVIGDPVRPDLTVEEVRLAIEPRWGFPKIGRITLVKPRLYGSYRGGKFSFGSLDKVLFTGSKEPFRLPDLDVGIEDGRARIDSDWGPIGLRIDGKGPLRDGFSGTLAAVAPQAVLPDCRGVGASLYGKLTSRSESPHFTGPVRLADLSCPNRRLRLNNAAVQVDADIDRTFDGAEGQMVFDTGALALGENHARATLGKARIAYRGGDLTAQYRLGGAGIQTPQAALSAIGLTGSLRTRGQFADIESEGDFAGQELRPGAQLDDALAGAESAGADTLAAALIGKMRSALRREQAGNRFAGGFVLRKSDEDLTLLVPQARLTGGSGAPLLALSRLQASFAGGAPRLSGNFVTGGPDMPRIEGIAERGASGGFTVRFAMADYASGQSHLAVPEMVVVSTRGGMLGFAGSALVSGALPGGTVRNLHAPIKGDLSPHGGLAVWRSCTPASFDAFDFAGLKLDRRMLTLCPPKGQAILVSNARGTRFAAGAPSLALSGRLGGTPVRIASGPVGFAVPGMLTAHALAIELGPPGHASHFRIANLDGRIDGDIAGRFAKADVLLDAVPLDILDASGTLRLSGGRLTLADAAFRLEDRAVDDRFRPLTAEGASLSLIDNQIVASAVMREPRSKRAVVRAGIAHNLASGVGSAVLDVDALQFDHDLQPDSITPLALGVIANASGTVRGSGRIDWNDRAVTSHGTFSTNSLDFAAAFGPVQGLSGKIVFTDLLGMVTAPAQKFAIASVNPGIEVNDGEVVFEMQPGNVLKLEGAYWPYLDGSMVLDPTTFRIGEAETRRLTFHVEGFDAAKFIQHMNLANIAATGVFDGTLPMIFDQNGGRIEKGRLLSRAPGGNVSYVGQLTYQDMSPMANFAFDALKSIDYREMRVELDGPLQGEMITKVSFDGIRQGKNAKRNFITSRIAKLPIRFRVSLRAPFFKLVGSMRSLYDPAYVTDPRTLGLIGADGKPISPTAPPPGIQPPVSDVKP